jgi:transposase-like protein
VINLPESDPHNGFVAKSTQGLPARRPIYPLKQLERENSELKRANEILRKAAAFFAQAELDRRPK